MTKAIAIIPARGGSKRIPRKNIRDFCGQPMISYPIRSLVETDLFDDIVVSTDSHEIAEIAVFYGAKTIINRPSFLSGSEVSTIDVIVHTLEQIEVEGKELVCCVYATNPFLTSTLLRFSYLAAMRVESPTYVTPIVRYGFPIQRSLIANGPFFTMAEQAHMYTHSQNLPSRYHETAQFWWGRAATWLERHPMQGQLHGILVPEWSQQDVDTEEDWAYAEIKYKTLQLNPTFALSQDQLAQLNPHIDLKLG